MSNIHYLPTQFKYVQGLMQKCHRISELATHLEADYNSGVSDAVAVADLAFRELQSTGARSTGFDIARQVVDWYHKQRAHMLSKPEPVAERSSGEVDREGAPICRCLQGHNGIHDGGCRYIIWKRAQ